MPGEGVPASVVVRHRHRHSRPPGSPVAGRRASHAVGFGGDAEHDLVSLDRQDGQADVALDNEFVAHPQRMALHGGPPCGPDGAVR